MKKLSLLLTTSSLVLACGHSQKAAAPAPAPGVAVAKTIVTSGRSGFQLRPFAEETLANGLRILWIKDDSLPRLSLNLMVEVGSIDEEPGRKGLNALTASVIDQGTSKHTAPQLSDALEQIGSEFSKSAGSDFTTLNLSGLAPNKQKMLDLFSEILLKPAFRDAELERKRSVILATLQKNQDEPSAFADEKSDSEIFGNHPYGTPVMGTVKTISSFRRNDLMRHYFSYYRPNNSILAVVGQFDDEFEQKVRDAFQGWTQAKIQRNKPTKAELRSARIVLLNKKGLAQTQVRMGHIGIPRNDKDFLTLRVANVILGGAFASRLNQRIRDDLGLTYSINSQSEAKLEPGSFEISTFTRHDKLADTVLETRKLLADFVQTGVKEEELDSAKALLVGQFPAALETPDRLAFNLMTLRRYGISDDYLRNFQKEVRRINRDDVNKAIRTHIHPENLQIVIYSDEKAIADQLSKLGTIEKPK